MPSYTKPAYLFKSWMETEDAVQAYLRPAEQDGLGCRMHGLPECLCDVEIKEPVPLVRVPPTFAEVETVEDLVRAAANAWIRYDVFRPLASGKHRVPEDFGGLSTTQLCQLKGYALQGLNHEKAQEQLGVQVHEAVYSFVRISLGLVARTKGDVEASQGDFKHRVIQLGRQGFSATEIQRKLAEEGISYSAKSIGILYEKRTGEKLKKNYRVPHRAKRYDLAVIMKLHDEGLSGEDIARRFRTNDPTYAWHRNTINKMITRELARRERQRTLAA